MSNPPTHDVFNIRGIPVTFPFVPYKCQIDYMECVITSLQESQNAMLESPTGTGKTLCLLASTLAWRQEKAKQLEAAHVALAEEASLFIEDELTAENMEKQNISKSRAPVIIYATRTHSQISQVVSEFQRTTYASSLSMCVLGSRSQLCIHPVVSQTRGGVGAINRACNSYVQRSSCVYHTNVELYKQNLPRTRDIEDLVLWGRRHSACPYFIAKDQQAVADIVFVPYNYIIDPLIRRSLNIDLKGSVVILDEAHNLEQVASDAASFDLSSSELRMCLTQIQHCLDAFGGSLPDMPTDPSSVATYSKNASSSQEYSESPLADPKRSHLMEMHDDSTTNSTDHAVLLKEAITALLNEFATASFPSGTNVKVSDSEWIFELFERIGITAESAPAYLHTVDQVALLMQEGSSLQLQMAQAAPSVGSQNSWSAANALSSFSEALRKMFMAGVPISEASGHFKAVLQRETSSTRPNAFQSKVKSNPIMTAVVGGNSGAESGNYEKRGSGPFDRQWSYKLSLWCFYPGLAMQSLMNTGIKSLIVTSGTLSPLDSFAYELSIPFPIRLENPHVIPTSQIWVGVLSTAVNGETLNSTYTNRSELYTQSLGHTLTNVARISPGGLLVFFPSYRMMEDCIDMWKSGDIDTNIWSQICRYKRPVLEPRESSKLKSTMKEFYEKVDQPTEGEVTGAVFFAVCRGKVSEGLDFSNNYGRTVVVTGLPFALNMDQKVKLKREYLDQQAARKLLAKSSADKDVVLIPPTHSSDSLSAIPPDKPLTGNEWYAQSAWRAVNQAIGRVIRHRNDYGAILFLDERFVGSASNHLSKWLRPHVHTMRTPGPMFQAVAKFFHSNAAAMASSITMTPTANNTSNTSSTSNERNATSRGAILSHVSAANSKRRSVFDTRNDAASSSTPLEAPPSINAVHTSIKGPKGAHDDNQQEKKSHKAASLLSMARSQLTSEAFQSFQTAMKKFKNRQMKRSELLSSLSTLLKEYPTFLAALDDYLSQGRAGGSNTPTLKSHSPSSAMWQEAKQVAPSSTSPNKFNLMPSPVSMSSSLTPPNSNTKVVTSISDSSAIQRDSHTEVSPQSKDTTCNSGASASPVEISDGIPIDPPSLKIISAPISKKRERVEGELDEAAPQPKRILSPPTKSSDRPVMQRRSIYGAVLPPSVVPDDSILDLSTHSPAASQETDLSSTASTKPVAVYSIASPSLELVGHPKYDLSTPNKASQRPTALNSDQRPDQVSSAHDSLQILHAPLSRTSSNDLEVMGASSSKGSSWVQGLSRGNSGGFSAVPLEVSPVSPTKPASHVGYGTPKKGMVDLLTGQMVPKGVPRRPSPLRPATNPTLIPESSSQEPNLEVTGANLESSEAVVIRTECPICAKTTNNFQSAPCGHRCCSDCWQTWLKSKMECPFCRGRVRAKKLKSTD